MPRSRKSCCTANRIGKFIQISANAIFFRIFFIETILRPQFGPPTLSFIVSIVCFPLERAMKTAWMFSNQADKSTNCDKHMSSRTNVHQRPKNAHIIEEDLCICKGKSLRRLKSLFRNRRPAVSIYEPGSEIGTK